MIKLVIKNKILILLSIAEAHGFGYFSPAEVF